MIPEKPQKPPSADLFRNRLDNMLNRRHELYCLADLVDWSVFDDAFGSLYCPDNGCPAKATRLMVGLQYLKHVYGMSDEAVTRRWVENPYWQYFCGATYFKHQLPIDPSSMTRFRQRIGESGCELILQATVTTGLKSKTHKRYEFGVKASIATTNTSNFVVGGMALPGRPYDGHTLTMALDQVRRLTGSVIEEVFVDRGYRGHGETQTAVFISGQRRGVKTQRLKSSLRRREAIEPVIGHLKSDGLLGRNYLKGSQGDQVHVMLSCAGHNLRLILRRLRIFCLQIWSRLWVLLALTSHQDAVASRDTSITGIAWRPAINCG